MQQPSTMQGKSLDFPDETREFEMASWIWFISAMSPSVGPCSSRMRWSEHVKLLALRVSKFLTWFSGRMRVRMGDASAARLVPRKPDHPPGHDAWIEGDEACVWLNFSGADEYAKEAPQDG